ncbi:MAG TPA: PASTA domain-containing protein, partial [Chitinophagaceae bacterium]|nr:PASTA domain-containing protein [Chitinophagaceae bacterium]
QHNAQLLTAGLKKDSSLFYYAGETGAVKQVLDKLNVAYTDSGKNEKWSSVYSKGASPVVATRVVAKNGMPDVKGMGLKDALYLLEGLKLKVIVKGKGRVISQSIEAGKQPAKGSVVIIELS